MNIRLKPEFRHALRAARTDMNEAEWFDLQDALGILNGAPQVEFVGADGKVERFEFLYTALYRSIEAYITGMDDRRERGLAGWEGAKQRSGLWGSQNRERRVVARIGAWVIELRLLTREVERARDEREVRWREEDVRREQNARDPVGTAAREAWLEGAWLEGADQ